MSEPSTPEVPMTDLDEQTAQQVRETAEAIPDPRLRGKAVEEVESLVGPGEGDPEDDARERL